MKESETPRSSALEVSVAQHFVWHITHGFMCKVEFKIPNQRKALANKITVCPY